MTIKSAPRFPPEILQLDEQIGEFMEYWGFKRIHGRVWLHLYLTENPLDVSELMRRLGVSKALMSLCIRELKTYAVIHEVGVAKHGTVLYKANSDLVTVVQNVLRLRERPMLARIRACQQLATSLPADEQKAHGIDPRKLKEMGKLVGGADRALLALVRIPPEDTAAGGGLLAMLELFNLDPND